MHSIAAGGELAELHNRNAHVAVGSEVHVYDPQGFGTMVGSYGYISQYADEHLKKCAKCRDEALQWFRNIISELEKEVPTNA